MGQFTNWIARKIPRKISSNSSVILTVMSIVGIGLTCYTAYKAGQKVNDKLEEIYESCEEGEEPTAKEIAKVVAPLFVPVIFAALGTGTCVVANYFIEANRLAASGAACALYKDSYDRYHKYASEVIGEEKDHEIREKVANEQAEERMRNHVFRDNEITIDDLEGELFYEPLSSRYLITSKQKVADSVNRMNEEMIGGREIYKSLNEWYAYLGLRSTDIGHELGWNTDAMMEVSFNEHYMDTGRKVVIISYLIPPTYGYNNLYG